MGTFVPPGPDYGGALRPGVELLLRRPRVSLWRRREQVRYGFRQAALRQPPRASRRSTPPRSMASARQPPFDRRRESSPLHVEALARGSRCSRSSTSSASATRRRANPAPSTKPVSASGCCSRPWCTTSVRAAGFPSDRCCSTPPSTASAGRFISESQPYGFGDFGQAGLQAGLHYDSRFAGQEPRLWLPRRRQRQFLSGALGCRECLR